ncbi:PREDICTED: centrosomal protein of 104 kDa isoform X1 [Bactrocera latifrons]|uniref:centrosomal protein of 104 kDa isoform X1 n=1 Tax=Bactrocera latifrons TaxID=174628 RepID=UPI0008DDDAAA|nr:PREDICTED: centrosomal protein of 104 kDa isoform X1 [Bactrocera latifrons]
MEIFQLFSIPLSLVDEDPAFPASELNTHGPTVHGWRSAPGNTITPHDIVLRFHRPAKICRIQILAHQFHIPEKVELWLHYSPKGIPSTPSSQCFDFLGFVALSDNAATNYKSRELQSVSVNPRRGTHLKLRLSGAHRNDYNPDEQVALIAVNVLGEELNRNVTVAAAESAAQVENAGGNGNGAAAVSNEQSNTDVVAPTGSAAEPALISICDDLLFSMYVEESIAEIIREMEEKKLQAVGAERFEYARKLKLCMTALRTAGERLGRYALAKRQAVQQEDFTTAKLRKEQIEMYKSVVLKHLLVNDLLEANGLNASNDLASEVYASKPILPPAPSLQDVAQALAEAHYQTSTMSPKSVQDDRSSLDGCSSSGGGGCSGTTNSASAGIAQTHANDTLSLSSNANLRKSHDDIPVSPKLGKGRSPSRHSSPMSSRQGSLRRRNKSAPRNSYEDYEERAVPALRHSNTNEFLRECQGTALLEADPNRGRSRLNDRERRQAALPILVFGNDMVEQFYSRQFQDREDGLISLRNFLKGVDAEQSNTHANNSGSESTAGPNKVARSAALLLHRAVRDAVYSVFSQATETVRVLFLEYVPRRVSQSEVARCVDRLLPELLAKSGDPSARIHTLAQHTILSIAACPEVIEQHLVAPALSRSVSSGTHPRLALSRMQMLEQLVLSQGIGTDKHSGLTCRALSECGCSGIHHPAEPVRKVAERILLLVYKVNPRLVRKQLPPDDDITRRNLLYRQLFTEFDKLDLERKKEMLEANKYSAHNNSDPITPPPNRGRNDLEHLQQATGSAGGSSCGGGPGSGSDSRSSPYGYMYSTKSPDLQSSPMRRSETRILKSKSGHALGGTNGYASGSSGGGNGVSSGSTGGLIGTFSNCNGKQQYNEQLKRSMISASNSRKGSNSNSNSESLEDPPDLIHCPFCDWCCSSSDQSQLDRHYWKSCPFLTKCPQCSQVLEVAALNYHLTKECEAKDSYVMCDRCTESVHKQLYDLHQMEDYCRELKTGAARCPLCHDDVHLPLDGGWKLHLLSSTGCPGNTRRRAKKSN